MGSLNSRDSTVISRVTTRVKVSVASGASASLPERCKDAMDISFGEMKKVKALTFSNSEEGEETLYCSLAE